MKRLATLISIMLTLVLMTPAHAVSLWGASAVGSGDLEGKYDPASGDLVWKRSSMAGEGIVATADWANGDFKMWWNIVENTTEKWTYTYLFSEGGKDISHYILEATNDSSSFNYDTGWTSLEGPKTWSEFTGSGNPGMPGEIYGVKFDDWSPDAFGFSLTTDRSPVYGNFYAKNGQTSGDHVVAWNNAFDRSFSGDLEDPVNFIIRPNGEVPSNPVPEPATIILLGAGLFGFGVFKRKSLLK